MTTGLSSEEWDELVLYIQNRQVIPVVGPEVVTIDCDGARVSLSRWLATRLSKQLKLTGVFTSLNDVAGAFLLSGGDRHKSTTVCACYFATLISNRLWHSYNLHGSQTSIFSSRRRSTRSWP
jgi:hypothetical protein